jgi:hypothetical protein
MLIDRKWFSSILDVRIFREADCNAEQYQVVEKVRGNLAVNKQPKHTYDGERIISET